jgi:N-acyl-L-homoserine lactone synthetase
MKLTETEMQTLENNIPSLAEEAGRSAFQKVMTSGRSVLVAKNDNIVKVFPNGSEIIVGKVWTAASNENNPRKWSAPAPVNVVNNDLDKRSSFLEGEDEGVGVFITADKELLRQYYMMRHEVYCVENGWTNYHSAENELDHKGKIIVAVRDGKVVGGMRLLTSSWVEYFSNEVAGTEFTYKNFMRNSGLDAEASISEISAFFVDKNHRDSNISKMLIDCALEEARLQGCIYNIGISTPLLNRSYRRDVRRLGYKVKIYGYPWKRRGSQNYVVSCPIVVFLNESDQN